MVTGFNTGRFPVLKLRTPDAHNYFAFTTIRVEADAGPIPVVDSGR